MNWHRLTVASVVLASVILPMAAEPAMAQSRSLTVPRCIRAIDVTSGESILVTESGQICPIQSVQVAPRAPLPPIVDLSVRPTYRSFELFNNSYQNILFLHLFPMNEPDQVEVFGGTRMLAPGRAWSVNLSQGCDYNLLVEYEDGSQNFYEGVDACSHQGIQLR
jgi:hypothetical protein